jgi:hypothetical protein
MVKVLQTRDSTAMDDKNDAKIDRNSTAQPLKIPQISLISAL